MMYPKIKSGQCPEVVATPGMRMDYHQCSLKVVKDGFCRIHHPDAVKTRRESSMRAYKEKCDASPQGQLNVASQELTEAWRLMSVLRDGDPSQEEILEAKTWLERNEKYKPITQSEL